jgi:fibronectin-binding autotransporter adhesin
MNAHTSRRRILIASIATLLGLGLHPAAAATLYWDGNDTTVNADGGAGTWINGTSTNWDTLPFGGADSVWTNGDIAVFGGTAATATIGSGGVTVGGLLFNTTGYTLAAGTNGLTFGSGADQVWLSAGLNGSPTATVSGTVAGTGADLNFRANPGATATTLTFSGISSGGWAGSTTIGPGFTVATTTTSGNINQVLNSTSGITLNGGAINAQLNAISDSAAITVNGGGTFGATSADAGGASANETIGAVTLNSGQFNLNWTNNPSSGSNIILSGFTRSDSTSALTVSFGANGRFRNSAISTDTAANEIIGPWATTGGANGIAAQTDYAVYSGGNGTLTARGIAASAQSTWSTTHALDSNYTLQNAVGTATNGRLDATRNINTLRNISSASVAPTIDTALDTVTVAGSSFSDGDVVTFGGTAPGGLATGTVYYVRDVSGTTFKVAATSGGPAIDITSAGTSNVTGGLTLSSGNNLGTFGILNGSPAAFAIGTSGTGVVTLPVANAAGNLYLTSGSAGITINAPIVNNGTGALTLVKSGSNNLFLSGANTYTGGTVINAGTLTYQNSAAWVSGQNVTIGGTSTLTASVGALAGGTLEVKQGATVSMGGTSSLTFSSTTGAGQIIFGGGSSAILNLGNASGFTGNAVVSAGLGSTNPRSSLRFSSIGDTVGSLLGWGAAGQSDSNQRVQIEFNGTAALTFDNRQIANLGRTAGGAAAKTLIMGNNSANAAHRWVINTDFLNQSERAGQGFILEGSNTGNNAFNGVIGNSTVSGSAMNVAKTGTGKWILGGANTFTGRLIAGQGTLSVATLNEAGVPGPLGMNNNIQLGGDERTNVGGNATELRLNGNNSGTLEYTGGAVTSSRSFFIGDTAATSPGGGGIANNGTGAITFSATTFNPTQTGITATRTLTLGGANTAANTVQGVIQNNDTSGVLNLAKSDAGRWILAGTNTYTGTTSINGGVLQAADGTGLPTGSILQLRGGVFQSSGTFTRNVGTAAGNVNWSTSSGGFAAIGGTLTLNLNGGTGSLTWNGSSMVQTGQTLIFGSSTADSLVDFQNGLNLGSSGSGQRTIQVNDNPGSSTDIARISGDITNTVAGWGIIKTGLGTLDLSGTNSYTGATTVNDGTLLITGSLSGTSAVNVATSGTLGGSGSISGDTTIADGGKLSPGTSVGTLTFGGNLDLSSVNTPGTLLFELGTPAASDRVVLTLGTLNLGSGTLGLDDFAFTNVGSFGAGTYTLFDTAASIAGSLDLLNTSGFVLGLPATLAFAAGGTDLVLNVVPEPSSLAMLTLGALAFVRRRARRESTCT